MFLAWGGYLYANKIERKKAEGIPHMSEWPTISILIPAHNEDVVIRNTLRSIIELDYPKDKLEVLVINDSSTDLTGEMVDEFAVNHGHIKPLHIQPPEGGKGKSKALNYALLRATGEYVVVYDADNNPEKTSLKYLVESIVDQPNIGAVVGKFRCINSRKNLLTRFINIETISFQWLAQAGRFYWFGITTIPGTNFLIKRDLLIEIGGWDDRALAEDTDLSIRIYQAGQSIFFQPLSTSWEQEPETWKVWFRQRTRWARGNQYVIMKYLPKFFTLKSKRVLFDLIYFFFTYFLFLGGVLLSHILFVGNAVGLLDVTLPGPFILIWMLAYMLFILEITITLGIEKTELTLKNFIIVMLMYVTYSQLWLVLVFYSLWLELVSSFTKKETKWVKTERFKS